AGNSLHHAKDYLGEFVRCITRKLVWRARLFAQLLRTDSNVPRNRKADSWFWRARHPVGQGLSLGGWKEFRRRYAVTVKTMDITNGGTIKITIPLRKACN